jgi:signal transduction histidine kinase
MRIFMIAVSAGLAAACLWLAFRLKKTRGMLRSERSENRQLRKTVQIWGLRSDAQGKMLEDLRRARHDLRHYLCALRGAEPPDCLRDLNKNLEREQVSFSGDWALSALVNYYCSEAARIGARMDCRLDLCGASGSYGADLYLVIGNLLENAVEALKREGGGWLRIRSLSSSGWFSFVIGNSCSKPLRMKNERYLSDKEPGRFGIGLDTVRRTAERYGGKAQFTADGKEFHASVFLPCPVPAASDASRPEAETGAGEPPVPISR